MSVAASATVLARGVAHRDSATPPPARGSLVMPAPARRQRVLFVIKHLGQGGTEAQLLQLIRGLDRNRFEARLCTVSRTEHALGRGLSIEPDYKLDASCLSRAARVGLAGVIDDYRPDVVHAFRDAVNVCAWLALRRSHHQPALLLSVRGRPVSPIYYALAGMLGKRAYKFTVNSLATAETLNRHARVPHDKIAYIPNAADASEWPIVTPALRQAARRQLSLPPDAFVWLSPARISYVKNQLGLALSFAVARRSRGMDPSTRLLLAGRPRDKVPTFLLPRWLRLLGMQGQVQTLGAVDDMLPLYQAADAMVLPSFAEAMPNATIEAHLCGLPVVVSGQANRDGLVVDGKTGYVVPTARVGALATALKRMVDLSPETRRDMGQRGRERIIERLGATPKTDAFARLYADAVEERALAGIHSL